MAVLVSGVISSLALASCGNGWVLSGAVVLTAAVAGGSSPVRASSGVSSAVSLGFDSVLLGHEILNPDSARVWWKQTLDMNEVVDALITVGFVGVRDCF